MIKKNAIFTLYMITLGYMNYIHINVNAAYYYYLKKKLQKYLDANWFIK